MTVAEALAQLSELRLHESRSNFDGIRPILLELVNDHLKRDRETCVEMAEELETIGECCQGQISTALRNFSLTVVL